MDALVNQYEEENNSKSWYFTMLFCFYTWKLKICAKKLQKSIFSKVSLVTPLRNRIKIWKPNMTLKTGLMMTIWHQNRFWWCSGMEFNCKCYITCLFVGLSGFLWQSCRPNYKSQEYEIWHIETSCECAVA